MEPSSYPIPEQSPLEPTAAYHARLAKWRRDDAWRRGQMKAVQKLDAKQTPTIKNVEPGD